MNLFFHSLKRFVLKKKLQIYPLNDCKVDCEENFFDLYIATTAF